MTDHDDSQLRVNGAPDNPYTVRPDVRYDYEHGDKCACVVPDCGGLGIPWGGWMRCDKCGALHLIERGDVLVPMRAVSDG